MLNLNKYTRDFCENIKNYVCFQYNFDSCVYFDETLILKILYLELN